jgi:hypothetical protein
LPEKKTNLPSGRTAGSSHGDPGISTVAVIGSSVAGSINRSADVGIGSSGRVVLVDMADVVVVLAETGFVGLSVTTSAEQAVMTISITTSLM